MSEETTAVAEPAPTPSPTPEVPPTEAPPKNVRYFKKVLANMPFFVNGKRVPFEPIDQNMGVATFEEGSEFYEGCLSAAQQRRGGVVLINAQIYEDLKKNHPFKPSATNLPKPRLAVFRQPGPPRKSPSPANGTGAAVAVKGNPVASPGEVQRVGPVGGGEGTGDAGTSSPAPQPAFKPATAKKPRLPVIKKTNSRSLSGGVPDPDPSD